MAAHDAAAALGYRMPAEWAPHEATWLIVAEGSAHVAGSRAAGARRSSCA